MVSSNLLFLWQFQTANLKLVHRLRETLMMRGEPDQIFLSKVRLMASLWVNLEGLEVITTAGITSATFCLREPHRRSFSWVSLDALGCIVLKNHHVPLITYGEYWCHPIETHTGIFEILYVAFCCTSCYLFGLISHPDRSSELSVFLLLSDMIRSHRMKLIWS